MNQRRLRKIENLEKRLKLKKQQKYPEVFIILHNFFEDEKTYTPNGQEMLVNVSDADIEQLLNESELRTSLKPTIIKICVVPTGTTLRYDEICPIRRIQSVVEKISSGKVRTLYREISITHSTIAIFTGQINV